MLQRKSLMLIVVIYLLKKNPKVFINDKKNTNFTTHLSLKSIPEKCQLRKVSFKEIVHDFSVNFDIVKYSQIFNG